MRAASQVSAEQEWHAIDSAAALASLGSDPVRGLMEEEARARLQVYGPNEIKGIKKASPWKLLLSQFKETLVLILIAASVISLIVGEALDAAVILTIVFASAGLGFYQEHRAEESLELLKKLAAPTATIIRDGETKLIPARMLVPGDIVILDPGDKVAADARILEAINLQIDEAVLTGESAPVNKSANPLPTDASLPERSNIAFSGTVVTYGRGKAVVFATGMKTEFGKIARLIETEKEEETPLERRMKGLGNWMIKILLVTVALVSLLGVLRGRALLDMFLWGVSLAVAAVPEALPAVVTGALAVGVYRMAHRNAIIRNLPATETLGSTTVICSDKTGTLTKGEMTVKKIYAQGTVFDVGGAGYEPKGDFNPTITEANEETIKFACLCASLCNDAKLTKETGSWKIIGDPTEGSLLVAATKAGIEVEAAGMGSPRVAEIPFTSERKMMTTVHKIKHGHYLIVTKGAPEVVLERSVNVKVSNSNLIMDQSSTQQLLRMNEEFAKEGFRTLALAYKILEDLPEVIDAKVEREMTFLAIMAMIDPPREECAEAVKLCEKAGIRVVMITGDHRLTATWVAKKLGIFKEGDLALTGAELEKLSEEEFAAIIDRVSVYSRTSPEHKTRIVEIFRKRGNIVAMTGDGINDAPALKKADIGVAMGITGTDVTKEASDMILADDNFATIVAAVYEGRGIFENIRKYLTYLMSANIGEILIMASAGLLGLPLPLLAKHLLFVNLATDGLPALALGTDPPDPRLMEKPPRNPRETIFETVHGWLVGIAVLLLVTAGAAFAYGLFAYGWTFVHPVELAELKARSMVFAVIILFEIFFALSCRSLDRTFLSTGPLGNKTLVAIVLGQAAIMPFIFQVPVLANIFSVTTLAPLEWLIVIALASSGFIGSELSKALRKR